MTNTIIKQNAMLLNTAVYPGHITIQHSIKEKEEAISIAKRFQQRPYPRFDLFSQPFLSHVTLNNLDFFAIEQFLLVNKKKVNDVHVSLAYSNRSLTDMELASCMPQHSFEIVPEDLKVVVFDCHANDPCKWNMVWSPSCDLRKE